jgi:hypothetical protein
MFFQIGCVPNKLPTQSQGLLFATIGSHPFEDNVFLKRPGSRFTTNLLRPEKGRSYFFAYGNSLTRLLVLVHELAGQHARNRLYIYETEKSHWLPLELPYSNLGEALFTADGEHVVVRASEVAEPSRYFLAYCSLRGDCVKITSPPPNALDDSPRWDPQTARVYFLRVHIVGHTAKAALLSVSPTTGETIEHIAHDNSVGGFALSPNTPEVAIWNREGLQIWTRDFDRPHAKATGIENLKYAGGGISWSKEGLIAIALNTKVNSDASIWIADRRTLKATRLIRVSDSTAFVQGLNFVDVK